MNSLVVVEEEGSGFQPFFLPPGHQGSDQGGAGCHTVWSVHSVGDSVGITITRPVASQPCEISFLFG